MSALLRILVALSSLGAAAAFAGPAPAPVPPAAPAAPKVKHITLKYQGTLREALKAIADKGGINLVITGDLKEPAEAYLNDVPADEALQIVADAHGLKVRRQGSIWTIRPLTADEREAKADEADSDSDGDHDEVDVPDAPDAPVAPSAPVPPVPPVPPTPPDVPSLSSDSGDLPDPVTDPKGFERRIEERVQRDLRAKLMRKFRGKHFGSHDGNTLEGTGHLVVAENQTVNDAVSYGGGLDVLGRVEGDAIAYGGGVHLGPHSEVEGDVVSFGGGITKDEGASVEGDEVAFGGGGFGRVVATTLPLMIHSNGDRHEHHDARPPSGHGLPGFLLWFAVLFGSGFLAMMFAPNRMRVLESELRRDPLRCGVTGFVSMLALPVLAIGLSITLIGIPVAVALVLVSGAGSLMGIAALANELGTRLPQFRNVRKTQAIILASGVLLMELVGLVPVLGGITWAVIGFIGLGAVIRSRFGTRQLGPVSM